MNKQQADILRVLSKSSKPMEHNDIRTGAALSGLLMTEGQVLKALAVLIKKGLVFRAFEGGYWAEEKKTPEISAPLFRPLPPTRPTIIPIREDGTIAAGGDLKING